MSCLARVLLACALNTHAAFTGLEPYFARCTFLSSLLLSDTSPRGHPSIEGESESWDFGLGAGFYVDATTPKFESNYNMYAQIPPLHTVYTHPYAR